MKHMQTVPGQTLAAVNAAYKVNLNQYEAITWPIYDTLDYTSAATTILTFFQTPNGQGGKTYGDTNMDTAGIIPAPNFYFVTGVEIQIIPLLTDLPSIGPQADAKSNWLDDLYQMYYSKNFAQLVIGAKKYITEPINKFPPTHRLDGFASVDSQTTPAGALQVITVYAALCGVPYEINPFLLPPNQPFQFSLNWPVAVTLASTHNPNIQVTFNGIMYRPAQ